MAGTATKPDMTTGVIYLSVAVDMDKQQLEEVTEALVDAGFAFDDRLDGYVLDGEWS